MKRPVVALLVLTGLLVQAAPGHAAPKGVPTALFMHGPSQLGEVDGAKWVAALTFANESPLTMDAVKPTAAEGKSMSYVSVVNDACTGTPMYPTFVAKLDGSISSDLTLALHSLSAPGTYTARVWVDTAIFQCNLEYVAPAAQAQFTLPAGESRAEVVVPAPSRKRSVRKTITVMIFAPQVPAYGGQVGRLRYDAAATPSGLSFLCTPRKGRSSCIV
ncbi:MAG TPA: hypothetical protein VNB94_13920 [Mycobacteriales bacterium]|nr:hypothetical protein [Mycobacteriales bacterium]